MWRRARDAAGALAEIGPTTDTAAILLLLVTGTKLCFQNAPNVPSPGAPWKLPGKIKATLGASRFQDNFLESVKYVPIRICTMPRWPGLAAAVLVTFFAPDPALADIAPPWVSRPVFWDDPGFAGDLGFTIFVFVVLTAALILGGVWFKRSKSWSADRFVASLFMGAVLCCVLCSAAGSQLHFSNRPPDLPRDAFPRELFSLDEPLNPRADDEGSGVPLAPTEPEPSN